MHRNDVAEFLRDGNNLILKLNNGETVLIENFFVVYDKVDSDLVFEEDGCILYWFDGVSGFKGIPGLEVLLPASAAGGSLLPWIIGGGAVIGGIIAAAGSRGGGDKNAWPIAVKDEITSVEDTPVNGNVLTNDRDPDGNARALHRPGGREDHGKTHDGRKGRVPADRCGSRTALH